MSDLEKQQNEDSRERERGKVIVFLNPYSRT